MFKTRVVVVRLQNGGGGGVSVSQRRGGGDTDFEVLHCKKRVLFSSKRIVRGRSLIEKYCPHTPTHLP